MTRPAERNQKVQIGIYLKRQAWVLLVLIVIAWVLDAIWFDTGLLVAKSIAIGALLSFTTQAIFAGFVFWFTGYRARQRIVSQLYRGQMLKWLVTAGGFAAIFLLVQPVSAFALLIGFVLMQMGHVWLLWHLG